MEIIKLSLSFILLAEWRYYQNYIKKQWSYFKQQISADYQRWNMLKAECWEQPKCRDYTINLHKEEKKEENRTHSGRGGGGGVSPDHANLLQSVKSS